LKPLRRRYATVVRGIIIIAVWTTDRGGSAVVTWRVISTRGGGSDRSSTDRSSTDAHRHSRAYAPVIATPVNASAIDTSTVDTTAIICRGFT